ncbi:MAG: helix-turn-helix domain-containing protein [Tannerella sp.]|jgi:transcriptional regulator with XRE-family HTH domain|nr:helix-turn-helix domain-containing protein [Tannerella sp.]
MSTEESKILANITQIRYAQKLTQKFIADNLKISEATYNRIESGKIALSYKYLADIAGVFQMSVIDVIAYPETYAPRISPSSTKVLVELDVSNDEFIKMGLKDMIVQVLSKR